LAVAGAPQGHVGFSLEWSGLGMSLNKKAVAAGGKGIRSRRAVLAELARNLAVSASPGTGSGGTRSHSFDSGC